MRVREVIRLIEAVSRGDREEPPALQTPGEARPDHRRRPSRRRPRSRDREWFLKTGRTKGELIPRGHREGRRQLFRVLPGPPGLRRDGGHPRGGRGADARGDRVPPRRAPRGRPSPPRSAGAGRVRRGVSDLHWGGPGRRSSSIAGALTAGSERSAGRYTLEARVVWWPVAMDRAGIGSGSEAG